MALKAYEDACLRAELFGQPKPDKVEFLEMHKHLDIVEFDEVDIKTAENTAMLNDDFKAANGGLNELNAILNSTQTKLNRLKGVCGSLTNFFRGKFSGENLSYSTGPSYVGHTNYDKDYVVANANADLTFTSSGGGVPNSEMTAQNTGSTKNSSDINSAVNDLKTMQDNENTALINKNNIKDIGEQVNSQISKLDKLIIQADRAQVKLHSQNKQIKGLLR